MVPEISFSLTSELVGGGGQKLRLFFGAGQILQMLQRGGRRGFAEIAEKIWFIAALSTNRPPGLSAPQTTLDKRISVEARF
jgi:hypothetical protein